MPMSSVILCSPKMPNEIKKALSSLSGTECVSIPEYSALPLPVQGHSDMLFFNIPKSAHTVVSRGYYEANPEFFDRFPSAHLILDQATLGNRYPDDIALDALSLNGVLYCLEKHTAGAIKNEFSNIVNVKQGYTACSVLKLNESAAITADPTISAAMKANGIRVLDVSYEGVYLEGYGCGFIGGSSAVINGTVLFFGKLSAHRNHRQILEFCRTEGLEIIDFPRLPLTDYGGIRFLTY